MLPFAIDALWVSCTTGHTRTEIIRIEELNCVAKGTLTANLILSLQSSARSESSVKSKATEDFAEDGR